MKNGGVLYSCDMCKYTTNRKSNFNSHLNRKTPCSISSDRNNNIKDGQNNIIDGQNNIIDGQNNIIEKTNIEYEKIIKCNACFKVITKSKFKRHMSVCKGVPKHTCRYCNQVYTIQQSLSRHEKACCIDYNKFGNATSSSSNVMTSNTNNNVITNNLTINNNMTNTNNLTINNNNDHSTNNINIINFDDTKFDHLDMCELKKSLLNLKSSDEIAEQIIKHIHFNPKYPEFQNVRASNLKPDYKYMDVFKNGWSKEKQVIVLHQLNSQTFLLTKELLSNEEHITLFGAMDDEEYNELNGLQRYHHNYIRNPLFNKRIEDKAKLIVYNETKKVDCSLSRI